MDLSVVSKGEDVHVQILIFGRLLDIIVKPENFYVAVSLNLIIGLRVVPAWKLILDPQDSIYVLEN